MPGLSAADNVTAETIEATRVRETRERMAAQRAARLAAERAGKRLTPPQIRALSGELSEAVKENLMSYRMSSAPEACTCGHAPEEHGHDPKFPGSTACTIKGCDCIAFDEAPEEDDEPERERSDEDDEDE